MTRDDLWTEQWLLSYEARAQSWLPSKGGGDHRRDDDAFGFLAVEDVTFYRPFCGAQESAIEAWIEPEVITMDGEAVAFGSLQ